MKNSTQKTTRFPFHLPLLAALFIALLALSACGGNDQNDLEAILDRGTLRVGIFGESPPFGYVDQAGQFQGRDAMIARRMAYEMFGDENAVEFIITDAANRIEFLTSFRVDVIIANFTVTPARAEQIDFALPYSRVFLGVIAPEGGEVTTMADLAGRDLIVTQGTTAEIFFTENHPEVNLVRFPDNVASFQALADGRGHAMAHDNSLVLREAFNRDGLIVVESSLGNQDIIAPAIRQNQPELLEWINDTTRRLREENFFYHVFEETMRDHFPPGTQPSDLMYN